MSDEGLDRYKKQLSYCFVQGTNINQEMVVKAWYAVAYVRYDKGFYFDELIARLSNRGIYVHILRILQNGENIKYIMCLSKGNSW